MFYQGDYLEDETVYVMFNTFTSNDPSASSTITNFLNTDVHIHKDNGLTQRNNAAGITVSVDFDGITGSHMIAIDTSDDTVGGFWVTGSDYFVRIEGTTVDAGTINAVVGHFSIENRFQEVDLTHIMGTILTEGGAGRLAAALIKFLDVATPAGTINSLPGADADGPGGIPISDAGGLDLDTLLGTLTSLAAEAKDANVLDQLRLVWATIESQRGAHTGQGNVFYVDPTNGDTHANGNRGGRTDPYLGVQDCHDNAVTDSNHDIIILVAGAAGLTTLTEDVTISKRYTFIRGPGRDLLWTRSGSGDTIAVTADGVELSGFQLETAGTGSGDGIQLTDADFLKVHNVWINQTRADGINVLRGSNCQIHNNTFFESGQGGSGQGVHISGSGGSSNNNNVRDNTFIDVAGDAILIEGGTTLKTVVQRNTIEGSSGWGVNIGASSTDAVVTDNRFGNNASGTITDAGTTTVLANNDDYDADLDAIKAVTDLLPDAGALSDLAAILTDTGTTIPALIAALNDLSAADVAGELATYDGPTKAEMDSAHALLSTSAALATVDGIVDAILVDTGTTIPALIAALNDLSAADVAGELATYDGPTKAEMDAAHALLSTSAALATVDGIVDAILVDTGTTIPALIAALNDISTAEVNAEVDDVLSTDTQSMLGQAALPLNPTIVQAIMVLYKFLRNKEDNDGNFVQKYADDGTTVDHKMTVNEAGGTVTRGEVVTGP